ncbi:uncharacterized protein [Arachis hypogaea]|uniref:uncharacterized protein isoform X1 n=1 Tax=Arachis hypogaea TaxID=3818 RepID=UPI0011057343|nr:3-isopropylmalate dehydrogenase isoform X1 [Arachis hypogaea]XP_029150168.1 3-isopropylmalate dehydrogenase isoform X1 [Arachis hypogaea]
MAPSLQLFHPPKPLTHFNRFSSTSSRPASVRCSAAAAPASVPPLIASGITYEFREMLLGGAALDATGVPMPNETLSVSKQSDAVLLGAIGGYKWDKNEKHLKPETGLLHLRPGLQVFANLRPATVFPQLVDASTLKKEVAEGVDLMVVRELNGGALEPMKMARRLDLTLRFTLLMRECSRMLMYKKLIMIWGIQRNRTKMICNSCDHLLGYIYDDDPPFTDTPNVTP